MYPQFIEVNGNKYKINTDYKIALACFEAINDVEISDSERFYAVLCLLLGTNVKEEDESEAFKKCELYLRCGKEQNPSEEEVDMDYEQDRAYINTSFRSCYNIDLKKENLHWWEYNEMIEGFDEQSIMSKIRYIRNIDLDDIKDDKERNEIIKQKERVELKQKEKPISKEEKDADDFFKKMFERRMKHEHIKN